MKWYHGTSSLLAEKILNEGFRMNHYEGIWGCGVYLTNRVEEAKSYGESVLVASVQDDLILHLDYHADIPDIFPDLSFDEEEACRLLREHAMELGYLAASMLYRDGCRHLIVYDTSAFSVIDLDEDATKSTV